MGMVAGECVLESNTMHDIIDLADWKQRHIKKMFREDRILANKHMPLTDRILFVQMERLYPELTTGKRVKIEAWYLAEKSGVSRSAVTRFLSAMYNGGYFNYNSILKSALNNGQLVYARECYVQELEACKHPERINTKDTPKRKRDRKKAMERLKCRYCKSENILYKVVPVCRDCGKEQE